MRVCVGVCDVVVIGADVIRLSEKALLCVMCVMVYLYLI